MKLAEQGKKRFFNWMTLQRRRRAAAACGGLALWTRVASSPPPTDIRILCGCRNRALAPAQQCAATQVSCRIKNTNPT